MTTLERKAAELSHTLTQGGGGSRFDPAVLLVILTAIIQAFKDCQLTPQAAELRAARPRLLDKVRLRRIIRANAAGDFDDIEAALLDAGEDLTTADVAAMYAEVPAP